MYPTNYLGCMKLCKEIALLRLNQNKHWNHEELFAQEKVDRDGGRTTRGSTTNPPDQK